jgi:NhaD family Na+/H+ antiporter
MLSLDVYQWLLIGIFLTGYAGIIFEHVFKINKSAVALLMAVLGWMVFIVHNPLGTEGSVLNLEHHLSQVSQIVFFLLGAMTIVEVIDVHHGFSSITRYIKATSKVKLLWLIAIGAFFLSSVLDNLTTTIVMLSVLRKMVREKEDRWFFGAMIVIAANAGGAWTPIGDVTTTMLWIKGNITALATMKSLFLPSLVSLCVSLIYPTYLFKNQHFEIPKSLTEQKDEPYSKLIFAVGIGSLIAVPLLKSVFHLPPFMGMLIGLGVLWLITDRLHGHERDDLKVPQVLRRLDVSSILFFLGILLSIASLESSGLLKGFAVWLGGHIPSDSLIAMVIGLASAVIDNVPLVAACMGMYDLTIHLRDSAFWQMIAYCAGTGGSILIIGSAAGVAFMGIEQVDFMWYFKRISLTALLGYFAGLLVYIAQGVFF